ncbi:MAG: Crp/Fnr family transcriptional regulator [Acidobacteriaceae bacterium]|nr:Crp/Fnr family transcriptional regulator [Acidobacteriaceae bacterium]MBV9442004.1 Crp/Fnr family transcriptional regulator [Acidobacteriaceae bacterium]
MNQFASAVRSAVLSEPEVTRLASLRRSTSLFTQGQIADSLFFIEEGMVKTTRTNARGGRIILTIRGAGDLVGEEAAAEGESVYYSEAEILTNATVFRIPRDVQSRCVASSPEWARAFVSYLISRNLALAEKVELLCLHDVEYRILHYLAELSGLVKPAENGGGYQLPITQLELADLIGATRETTSTTLNQLERRGLIRLSRRMLTIQSPEQLRVAAQARAATEKVPNVKNHDDVEVGTS